MQVLVALVREPGSVVSQDDLVNRCWRGLSVSDDAIYRCISKLRKLAADCPDGPFAIEAIPGVGYRLTSSTSTEDDPAAISPHRRFRLRTFAIGVALAALAVIGVVFWIGRGSDPEGRDAHRVTVHAFDTLSHSQDARALARRVSNEVVNELGDSQIETVLAGERPGTASSPIQERGLVVTGLMRDDTPNVVAAVRVEDAVSRAALWSMEFKRDRREASDLPQEVAARVADVVNMAIFARTADPPLTDAAALSALLQITDMIRDTPDGAWAQMLERAKSVVARHPEFAFGHSVLATAYAEAADNITISDRAQAMHDAAWREANITLKLDSEDAGAYAVLAGLQPAYDYRAREAILLRGIKLARHPKEPLGALYSYEGTLLENVGRLREALSFQLIGQATDQWGPSKTAKLARVYANSGNLPLARSWMRKAVQRWPNHSGVTWVRRYIAGFYEPPEDAQATITEMDAQASPDERQAEIWRIFTEAKTGRVPKASAVRSIREAAGQRKITRENEIMMLAALGEPRLAIEAANFVLDKQQQLQAWFLFTPVTRNVRLDPGFVQLANRMGLIRYWRETGKRPDFCTSRAASSECSPQLLAALK